MSDLGQLLRKARTQRGFTLDELQEMTKIRKRYLEAIEDGNYKVLPGNFYVRAFIKSYSEAVGLEPDEVLKLYRSEVPATQIEPAPEPKRRKRRTTAVRNTDKLGRWLSVVMFIAFPLLIVGVVYYYIIYSKQPEQNADSTIPLTQNKSIEDNSDIGGGNNPVQEPEPEPEPEPALVPELTLLKSEEKTDFYVLKNVEQLQVDLEVIGDSCWTELRKDNNKGEYVVKNTTFKKGDIKQWIFDGGAYFHFGKANAIQVKINDIPINVGDGPNPRHVQIDIETSSTDI